MLFKLVVTLFVVANGVPSDKPAGVLTHKTTFPTEEACKNYFNTDAGQQAKSGIQALVDAQNGALLAQVSCAKVEDNTI